MDCRKLLQCVGLAGSAFALGLFSACSSPKDAEDSTRAAVTDESTFDANNLLEDKTLRDTTTITVEDIQGLFDKTPSGRKSGLADYEEDGKSAATILVDAAVRNGINPLELVVRAQMHGGLVASSAVAAGKLDEALGCASENFKGLTKQAECAAGLIGRAIDDAKTSFGTATGWVVGQSKTTRDGVRIKPENAATAALYTYTPYVGKEGGGNDESSGGAYMHVQIWNSYAKALNYDKADTSKDGGSRELDAAVSDSTDVDGGPTAEADGAAPTEDAGSIHDDGGGLPADGSEDKDILRDGTSPPPDNTPREAKIARKPSELGAASEDEIASKPKASGCSATGRPGDASVVLAGVAFGLMLVRRRRGAHQA